MSSRAGFGRTVLIGVGSAVLAAVGSAKSWAHLTASAQRTLGFDAPALRTAGEVPLASALSLVALALWGALLVSRGRLRRVLAVLGCLDALAVVAIAVRSGLALPGDVVRSAVVEFGTSGALHASLTGWFWVAGVCALLTLLCFAVAARDADTWPAMGSRYDAPHEGVPADPRTDQELWKALDEGQDPT